MRNFSKTLISMAAVMAVGSAMAAGAMAGTLTVSTTDAEGNDTLAKGTVSISNVTPDMSQYTLLVVEGVEVTVDDKKEIKYNANEETIVQIDQNDDGKPFGNIVVGTDLTKGATYQIRVGNNMGGLDEGYFTVPSDAEPEVPEVQYKEIVIGDVNDDNKVNAKDTSCLLTYVRTKGKNISRVEGELNYVANTNVNKITSGGSHAIGDVNDDGKVNAKDTSCLLTYVRTKGKNTSSVEGELNYVANTANKINVVVE